MSLPDSNSLTDPRTLHAARPGEAYRVEAIRVFFSYLDVVSQTTVTCRAILAVAICVASRFIVAFHLDLRGDLTTALISVAMAVCGDEETDRGGLSIPLDGFDAIMPVPLVLICDDQLVIQPKVLAELSLRLGVSIILPGCFRKDLKSEAEVTLIGLTAQLSKISGGQVRNDPDSPSPEPARSLDDFSHLVMSAIIDHNARRLSRHSFPNAVPADVFPSPLAVAKWGLANYGSTTRRKSRTRHFRS